MSRWLSAVNERAGECRIISVRRIDRMSEANEVDEELLVLSALTILFTISRFWAKNFVPSAKVSSRLIETYFNVSGRFFWVFLRKNIHFISFSTLSKKKRINFWRKALGRIVKLLRLQRNSLEETFFWKVIIFYFAL